MLCQQCRTNEANIQIIKSVDGKQTEEFLCEQCAQEREELDFSFEPQFSLHKLFSSMLNQDLLENRESMLAHKTQCPACGLSFAQFSQVGRLGCRECFNTFDKSLKPLLRRIHAGSTHSGKIPVRAQRRVKYMRQLDRLKDELQSKVANEKFEEAAVLRDKIKAMEKDLASEMEQDDSPGKTGALEEDQGNKGSENYEQEEQNFDDNGEDNNAGNA
ncbi:MAG: UvrB/UvrC motif-containing protein [Bacillota bacterium]